MESSNNVPYWRLSNFYLFYFAALGVLVPFWSLYLKSLNFDASQIGELIAIIMATKIIAPYIWGWIADHTGYDLLIVRIASILSFLLFALIFINQSYWWIAFVMMAFSFFWNAALPQFEAITMNHLRERVDEYSKIRVWGSLGFVAAVIVMGWLLETYDESIVPIALFFLYGIIMLTAFMVPVSGKIHHVEHQGSIFTVLKNPVVLALIAVCFFLQFSHGSYYTFYSIYLQDHGYQSTAIGGLWALGVIAEVVLFLYVHVLLPKYGHRNLLLLALILTVVRWVLIAFFVEQTSIIVFAQLLHAASFGLFHAISISLFHRYFVGKHQGRGQALYASVSFGAGGALGSLFSGFSWEYLGSTVSFLISAAAVLVAIVITYVYIHTGSNVQDEQVRVAHGQE